MAGLVPAITLWWSDCAHTCPWWRALARSATMLPTDGRKRMRRALIAILTSLTAMPALADDDIVLRGMGSFHIGGRIAEVSGKEVRQIQRQPGGPMTKLDPNGEYMVEQMYVQYF